MKYCYPAKVDQQNNKFLGDPKTKFLRRFFSAVRPSVRP